MSKEDYLSLNNSTWNNWTSVNLESEFYDNKSFIEGRNSLNDIELAILGDLKGKKVLHLQCHFGQDSISLARMGADVTAVDFSEEAIKQAQLLSKKMGVECKFILSDVYSLKDVLDEKYDLVFSSYGTIGWLPDIKKWADIASSFVKPSGRLLLVEFHPVVWMFDDDFTEVKYRYFNSESIVEELEGTYANTEDKTKNKTVCWNHGLAEITTALLSNNMQLLSLQEYDYSPYNCLSGMTEINPGKYQIKKFGNKIPMVYSLEMRKV